LLGAVSVLICAITTGARLDVVTKPGRDQQLDIDCLPREGRCTFLPESRRRHVIVHADDETHPHGASQVRLW
jgi:hypothetical protein